MPLDSKTTGFKYIGTRPDRPDGIDKVTGKAGGYDVCTPLKTPPQDSVFLKAKAKIEGITAADFVGVKRKIFRHSIAEIAESAESSQNICNVQIAK